MWPNEIRGGGPYKDPRPDCRNNGPHRYGSIHFLPTDKSVVVRACRLCGTIKYSKPVVKDGRIEEIELKNVVEIEKKPEWKSYESYKYVCNLPCNITKHIDNQSFAYV